MGSGSSVDKNAPDLVSKELCSTAIQGLLCCRLGEGFVTLSFFFSEKIS